MNRYNCLLILPEGTKDITVIADSVHPDSTCATRFHKRIVDTDVFGTRQHWDTLVAQYPTERLIIESIDQNIENEL